MEIVVAIIIILVLILLNGLFVAAEFAIVGVPRATIERLASQGHRIARQVRQIIHDPRRQDRYIATAQSGITLASLGLGMYGEHVIAEFILHTFGAMWGESGWLASHTLASVLAIIILSYFHIVLGEMVPKSLALISAERTALWITPPMLLIQLLFSPLVLGLNGIGNGILHIMGIKRDVSAGLYHTPEEIEYLVRESEEGGMLRPEASRVVRDLFEFGDLTAREVMVPRVRIMALPRDATGEQIAALVSQARYTRYPVYDGDLDHIAGMIHIKDLFRILRAGTTLLKAGIRPVPYLPETAEIDTVLAAMRRAQVQLVVVMDEHGGTAGIITLEDLFEEVIGNIDEGYNDAPDIARIGEGYLRVEGTVRLDRVGEALDIPLEHEEIDTVSGLVLTLLDRPPQVGDVVIYQQLRLKVIAIRGRGVERCLVTVMPRSEAGMTSQGCEGTE